MEWRPGRCLVLFVVLLEPLAKGMPVISGHISTPTGAKWGRA